MVTAGFREQPQSSQSVNPLPSLSAPSAHRASVFSPSHTAISGLREQPKSSQSKKPLSSLSRPSAQRSAVFSSPVKSQLQSPNAAPLSTQPFLPASSPHRHGCVSPSWQTPPPPPPPCPPGPPPPGHSPATGKPPSGQPRSPPPSPPASPPPSPSLLESRHDTPRPMRATTGTIRRACMDRSLGQDRRDPTNADEGTPAGRNSHRTAPTSWEVLADESGGPSLVGGVLA